MCFLIPAGSLGFYSVRNMLLHITAVGDDGVGNSIFLERTDYHGAQSGKKNDVKPPDFSVH